jgi:hypothetical protein
MTADYADLQFEYFEHILVQYFVPFDSYRVRLLINFDNHSTIYH